MEWIGLLERGAFGALLIVVLGAISDRLRPYYGSVLASVPTTTAVSLGYIAHDHGTSFAAEAATSSLMTQVSNLAFVALFAGLALVAAPRRRWWAVAGGVAAYALLSVVYLVASEGRTPTQATNLPIYAVALGLALLARHMLRGMPAREHAYGRPALRASHLQRAALGGTFVMVATVLAERLGPHWGGLFASFPATFMSLLLVAYRQRSLPYFLEQALGVIPSTANIAAYLVAVHWAYPALGIAWGTVVAYVAFAALAVPIAAANIRSLRRTDERLSEDAIVRAATDEPQ